MEKYRFVKEPDNKWYIVLPEWEGEKADLEMVMGADTMLDIFAQDQGMVDLYISEEEFENYFAKLTHKEDYDGGAWYDLNTKYHDFEVWICEVTKFVFGYMPKTLYLQKV